MGCKTEWSCDIRAPNIAPATKTDTETVTVWTFGTHPGKPVTESTAAADSLPFPPRRPVWLGNVGAAKEARRNGHQLCHTMRTRVRRL